MKIWMPPSAGDPRLYGKVLARPEDTSWALVEADDPDRARRAGGLPDNDPFNPFYS